MPTIAERIRRAFSPNAVRAYRDLVLASALGREVDESAAELALKGRTPEQLRADIEKLQQRVAAAREIEDADAMQPELTKLQAELTRCRQEVARIEAEWRAAKANFDDASVAAMSFNAAVTGKRSRAVNFLQRTASKEIAERYAEIANEINGLRSIGVVISTKERESLATTEREMATLPDKIEALKREETPSASTEAAILRAQLLKAKATAGQIRERLKTAAKEAAVIAGLEAKQHAVSQKYFDPEQVQID